jgi:PAS domain S-box-containing protein
MPLLPSRILVVAADEALVLPELAWLEEAGYEVVRSIGEAWSLPGDAASFELVILDSGSKPSSAVSDALRRLGMPRDLPVLLLSADIDLAVVADILGEGAGGHVWKDAGKAVFQAAVAATLDLHRQGEGTREGSRGGEPQLAVPDFVCAVNRERRLIWVSYLAGMAAAGAHSYGRFLYDLVDPACLPDVSAAIEGALSDGRIRSYRAKARAETGQPEGRWFETCASPIRDEDRIVGVYLENRDVSDEVRLASGLDLSDEARRREIDEALKSLDFGPIKRLLDGLYALTGCSLAIVSAEGELLAGTLRQSVCADFYRMGPSTKATCLEHDDEVLRRAMSPDGSGVIEYRCPNGLRGIVRSLLLDGCLWGSIILGQFRYQDEDPDPAALAEIARSQGWDAEAFLSAVRELPVFDREKALGVMTFVSELGDLLARQALALVREGRLVRHFRMSEAARADSERRYRLLAENAGDVIWTLELPSWRYSYISPSVMSLRGMTVEEALVESMTDTITPASMEKARRHIGRLQVLIAAGDPRGDEAVTDLYEMVCKDGVKTVEITARAVSDGKGHIERLVGITRDATKRVKGEEALKKALADKDVLFGELQHRVKNSLALIASLLSLESSSLPEGQARDALESARGRIDSIAQLYQQLYSSRSVSDIRMGDYLHDVAASLVESLSDASASGGAGIALEFDPVDVVLDTRRAVSVALVLHELVVNAIKYGCPGGKGRIRIELEKGEGRFGLSVSDEGPGLPPGFSLPGKGWDGGSLGFTLVSQLAGQLAGSLSAGPGPGGRGASFHLSFPLGEGRSQA